MEIRGVASQQQVPWGDDKPESKGKDKDKD